MGFLQKVGDFFKDAAQTAVMFVPGGATALAQRTNNVEKIEADFKLESARLATQTANTIRKIDADWNLQQDRQEFQAFMENRREEFEVKKLEAQWLHNYNMQKDAQQFNRDEAIRKHQESVALANLNQENQQKIERFRQDWENVRLQKRQDFELVLFEARKKHELELKQYDRETSIIIANIQLRNTFASTEYARILDKHPLVTLCTPTLDFYKNLDSQNSTPLLIIISPPALEFEKHPHAAQGFHKIETKLTDNLRDFLDQNYSLSGSVRPTKFLGGTWETKRLHAEGAMEILHYTHKSVPTVVIECKVDGNAINIYLGFWDSMDITYKYKKVMSIPWQDVLYPLARENAKKWREARNKLLELGRTPAEIEARGGDNQKNLRLLEEEEINQQYDIKTEINYHINGDEYTKELAEFLAICHCIFAGLAADQYHLCHSNIMPVLPQKLPELLQNVPDGQVKQNLIKDIINIYQESYRGIQVLNPTLVPELALDFAVSLLSLQESSFAREQLNFALTSWLQLRQVILTPQSDQVIFTQHLLKAIASVVTPLDQVYITKVNHLLFKLNEPVISIIDLCYNRGSQRLKSGQINPAIIDFSQVVNLATSGQKSNQYASILDYAYYNRGVCYVNVQNYQEAIADFTQAISIKSDFAECYYKRGQAYYSLRQHQKAIADYERALYLKPDWSEVALQRAIAQGVLDDIIREQNSAEAEKIRLEQEKKAEKIRLQQEKGEPFNFDVVTVNSQGTIIQTVPTTGYQKKYDLGDGIFLEMAYIPAGSFTRDDGKIVTIKEPFYMGKYPVTNEQYKQIMGSSPSPSRFDAPKQPVVYVTWDQAKEFIARLNAKIEIKCYLPSEMQWWYACIGNVEKPDEYHFGPTITKNLANFGNNEGKTTEVGHYKHPNAFGLYDMHGNVWEWCEDYWHDDYSRTPIDGSPNLNNTDDYHVVRGGAWNGNLHNCRSAYRSRDARVNGTSFLGFRLGGFAASTN